MTVATVGWVEVPYPTAPMPVFFRASTILLGFNWEVYIYKTKHFNPSVLNQGADKP